MTPPKTHLRSTIGLLVPEPPPLDSYVHSPGKPTDKSSLEVEKPEAQPAAVPAGQLPELPADDELSPPAGKPPKAPADPAASFPAGKPDKPKRGSRAGSRLKPYETRRIDPTTGQKVEMIKQSFTARADFDELWREVPGLLPRGVSRHVWAEHILRRAIDVLKRQKAEREGDYGKGGRGT